MYVDRWGAAMFIFLKKIYRGFTAIWTYKRNMSKFIMYFFQYLEPFLGNLISSFKKC